MMKLFDSRLFYTALLWILLPYAFIRLFWRARKQPEYLHNISERFAIYSEQSSKPIIWLHAVSVGETHATQSLVQNLRVTYPSHQILLTHTTPTGRTASLNLYGSTIMRAYLPYDYPFAVNSFLRHFRPQLGILMETEIWFNLIHACHSSEIPLLLLNARMSEKSARGYSRFGRLTRTALRELFAVAAQTNEDAARLTQLGAVDVSVTGNLKFDIEPPAAMLELGKHFRAQFGAERKIFLAASTRDGEEKLLLDALDQVLIHDLLLVIVPRHPQRFTEVANLLIQRGISFKRRSKLQAVHATDRVVLGDSMGEMFAYYAAADVAFIGGSLLPYGGQNLIEACSVGTPVLVGPHTYNFSEATRLAINAGAAMQVTNVGELILLLKQLFAESDILSDMRNKCDGFIKLNRGATERSLRIITSTLNLY